MQASNVKFSELNEEFRIDAEYYAPDNLRKEEIVIRHKHERLGNLCDLIAGPFGSTVTSDRYDPESEKRYIRGKDVQEFFLEQNDAVYVESDLFDELPQFHLKTNDLLITVVGMKFGKVSIIRDENTPAIFSCKSTLLRNAKINVWYLLTYLSCSIGYGLIRRGERGAAQPGINLFDIRTIPVPLFSSEFENTIEKLIQKSLLKSQRSTEEFTSAQSLLLEEIGLNDWQPEHKLSFIKSYSHIEKYGRIDAEYYQPKYEEIITAVKASHEGWGHLGEIADIKDKSISLNENQEYKYIELSNINDKGEVTSYMTAKGLDLPSRARRKVTEGDVIVSSIEGSLSSIALIEAEHNNSLCSTGFYVINSKICNSETLLVFLKSIIGQSQLKKGCNGTILTAINKEEFGRVVIPKLTVEVQNKIQRKVIDSFNLRNQSKHLQECAKRMVEIAIEQDEQAAIDWLKIETKEEQGAN